MSFVRSFVTIGSHHKGPHVDALYALAERCGAKVIVVGHEGEPWGLSLRTPPPAKRLPYAGFDPDDLKIWSNLGRSAP
ncbi:hypothetical protein ASG47_19640 [Devosia sp. Leaf420]|uniref:hypothetical protein n=1 Tax=Devosia sp. Leaf420 TaxID=1736374 RepID=UPI0007139AC0|nr:hypothetical protein [Devosia sp. Leaf420]KQT50319.1 hypothetical protein ASG47_19640 [Devosia sp. Leaf420]